MEYSKSQLSQMGVGNQQLTISIWSLAFGHSRLTAEVSVAAVFKAKIEGLQAWC